MQADVVRRKARGTEIRDRAGEAFRPRGGGIDIARQRAGAADALILEFVREALGDEASRAARGSAVIAIGGLGRGELAPYSDIDLLFLEASSGRSAFRQAVPRIVQACWHARFELGHGIRTVSDCIALARRDAASATSLIETRLLWGSEALFESLRRQFRRRVVDVRRRQFVSACIAARASEGSQPGVSALELQPNVKRSLGGLRDLHLIRWLGFALFRSPEIDSLRQCGAITSTGAELWHGAEDLLTRVRVDLHLADGHAQDVLNADKQIRIRATPESMLRLYRTAALYGVLPSARLEDAVRHALTSHDDGSLSPEAAGIFLDILDGSSRFGPLLRSMYDAGLLEFVIPDRRHARCLMQFNQYHHYTVDEHTLRAVETAGGFAEATGPVRAATSRTLTGS
jgi:UTP:GlnB (protein PII) uridylyltransferase